MELFHGTPLAPGVAIAQAACLKVEFGLPAFDSNRLKRIGQNLMRYGAEASEPEMVVLVADTIPAGIFSAPIAGLSIIGAAGGSPIGVTPGVPAVCNLGSHFAACVEEDDIVIVDGNRGRVYVAPDAATLARYQTPARRAGRVLIDSAHIPARTTSDDRIVKVYASVRCLSDVDSAMTHGADGLVIEQDNDFFAFENEYQTYDEQLEILMDLVERSAGQPVCLCVGAERLALSALSRAAAQGPLHLVIEDPAECAELKARIESNEALMEERDEVYGPVAFEVGYPGKYDGLPDGWACYSGLFVTEPLDDTDTGSLLLVVSAAKNASVPISLVVPATDWDRWLAEAIEVGAARVVVPPDLIAEVKDGIRSL